MWIVRLALRRPYTFVVLSLLLFIVGPVVMLRTPVDIFPNIDIPVVSVIWNYAGMSPEELSNRIVLPYERSLTTTVNDIEHSESQTLNGIAVIKIFFRPYGQHLAGGGAGHRNLPDSPSSISAGNNPAAGHSIQCLQRARIAAWALRKRPHRAAVE